MKGKGKKVSIVFEETGPRDGGAGFIVYIEGIAPDRLKAIASMSPEERREQLGSAEFWATGVMPFVGGLLRDAGVMREVVKMTPEPGKGQS